MKEIKVNKEMCLCCGACYNICNKFTFDEEGHSEPIKKIITDEEAKDSSLVDAIESCPTGAISLEECEGKNEE